MTNRASRPADHRQGEAFGVGLRGLLVVASVALVIVALSLPVSNRLAEAYGSTGNSWDSLGCDFSGVAGAYSTGESNTYRFTSCGTYAMARLQYKTGGAWYGPYYAYQYNNYLYAASYVVFLDVERAYTGHQIHTSGSWQQIENIMQW